MKKESIEDSKREKEREEKKKSTTRRNSYCVYLTVYALLLLAEFCYGIVPLFDLIFTFISTVTIWSVVKAIAMLTQRKYKPNEHHTITHTPPPPSSSSSLSSSLFSSPIASVTSLRFAQTKKDERKIYKPNANWLGQRKWFTNTARIVGTFFLPSPISWYEEIGVVASFFYYYCYLLLIFKVVTIKWNMFGCAHTHTKCTVHTRIAHSKCPNGVIAWCDVM